ncbi:ATP-binding cassette domain-containing protein [Polaromonas sp.]|uniref:ABC transporter ATP-binding protein n=1 Tax=Polaromonas sp. TaxID=1869339 RepID=UPI0037526190
MLQILKLCFSYPDRTLFTDWSAYVGPGVTLIRGGDGRGKSPLLRLLAGLLAPDAGELHIHGVSLHDAPEVYRAKVFFIEPRTEAFDALTPVQYFDMQRLRHPAFDDRLLAQLVDGLSLEEQMAKQLYMLSTGSKRKVFLAAAFASGAAVTLLDMPFAALDKASIGFVMGLLEDASAHSERAWVVADYAAPANVRLASVIDLGD